jgi:cytochrome c oxidase subunit 2
MHYSLKRGVLKTALGKLFPLSVCFAQTAEANLGPTSIFSPASTSANSIFGLSLFVIAVAAVIFVVVFSLLVYTVFRFRKRRDDDGREPPQVYGSNQVELAWTVISDSNRSHLVYGDGASDRKYPKGLNTSQRS